MTATQPRRALIVVDVQNEYFDGNLQIEYPPVSDSLPKIVRAMDAATAAGIPVVVIRQDSPADAPAFAEGSHGWQLHAEVERRQRDVLFGKPLPSAFSETGLGEWLQARGIDTLTVVGYMTHNCDDTTIKHAFDRGIEVEFLHDASGAVSYANRAGYATAEEIHRVFAVVEQSRFAAVLSVEEWERCLATGEAPVRENILDSYANARKLREAKAA
ncbi:cysteine hydrolase [Dyella sp. LX-66]|uniref:cysteine hydrolase family protein n=1 Tax=unclassified Dyella TaxID=2634549 RepID=UPI001BE062DD|nr:MULTISPECIES: cysteine hydrolase family protein [unclassified Dyella]MBT2118568.1 cysteine hydrolase [Dyella sp. LX-1]MBT2142039.1 cysteine hydrolase [Dyella sp. LX-66]